MAITPATAAKIRSHKFGRRRLCSDAAWTRYNKLVKNEGNARLLNAIANDTEVQAHVTAINTAINLIFTTVLNLPAGLVDSAHIFDLTAPSNMFIPRSMWYGYITFPTGQLTAAQRDDFGNLEGDLADAAGLLRARIAEIMAVIGLVNDIANEAQSPNRGGIVGGP